MSATRQIADEKFAVHYSGGPGSELRVSLTGPYTLEAWVRPSHPTGMTVYSEPLFTGVSRRLPHGRYDNMAGFTGNGNFGSVEVPPGVTAILFDGPGCKGGARRITADAAGMAEWAGKVKSLVVMDRFHARQAYAVFYAAAGYGGAALAVAPGIYADTKELGFAPACADVPPGVAVQVYAGVGLTGESAVIDADHLALWESWAGRVRSMAVRLSAARQFRGGQTGVARVLTAEDGSGLRLEMEQTVNGLRPPSWLFHGRKLNDGHWHHLGILRQTNRFAAYLDGQKIADGPLDFKAVSTLRLAADFRGRVALARVWDKTFDSDMLRDHRFAIYDAPFPAGLRLTCRVNDAGAAMRELVAGADVALPVGAVIVHAHLPVDPMQSGMGQKMALAMQAHGGEELKKAREEQAATVAKAHTDTAAQLPMRQARARMEARLGALQKLEFLERPGIYFSESPSHSVTLCVRNENDKTKGFQRVPWHDLGEPIQYFTWKPVSGQSFSLNPSVGSYVAGVMDDTAAGRNSEYRIRPTGQLLHTEWDDVAHRALVGDEVLLEHAAPDVSPMDAFERRWSMAIDRERQILYWSEGRYLYRGSLTSDKKLVAMDKGHRIAVPLGMAMPAPLAMVVDPRSGDLIWVDGHLGKVRRVNCTTGVVRDLYPAPNPRSAIGVDAGTGALFWCSERSPESDFVAAEKPGLIYSFQDFNSNGDCGVQLPIQLHAIDHGHMTKPAAEVFPADLTQCKVPEGHPLAFKMPAGTLGLRMQGGRTAGTAYLFDSLLTEVFDAPLHLAWGFSLSLWLKLENLSGNRMITLAPVAENAAQRGGWSFHLGIVAMILTGGNDNQRYRYHLRLFAQRQDGGRPYEFYEYPLGDMLAPDDWIHFGLSVQGDKASVHYNGKPRKVAPVAGMTMPADLATQSPARYRVYVGGMQGVVANLRYWDRPVGAAEMEGVYATGPAARPHLGAGDRLFDPVAPRRPEFRPRQMTTLIEPGNIFKAPRLLADFTQGMTVEFWLKPENWYPEDGGNLFTLRSSTDRTAPEYAAHRFRGELLRAPGTECTPAGWLHLILTADRNGGAWYSNGVYVTDADAVQLGAGEYDFEAAGFFAFVAVCRIWNRSLSYAEMEKLRSEGPGEVPVLRPREAGAAGLPAALRKPYIMLGDVDGADPCVPLLQADAQYGFGVKSAASTAYFEHVKALHDLHNAEAKAQKDQHDAEVQRAAQVGLAQAQRNQDVAHGHQMVDSKKAETDAARAAENEKKRLAANDANDRRANADQEASRRRTDGQQQADSIRDEGQRRHDQIVNDANKNLSNAQSELANKQREKREKMGG